MAKVSKILVVGDRSLWGLVIASLDPTYQVDWIELGDRLIEVGIVNADLIVISENGKHVFDDARGASKPVLVLSSYGRPDWSQGDGVAFLRIPLVFSDVKRGVEGLLK